MKAELVIFKGELSLFLKKRDIESLDDKEALRRFIAYLYESKGVWSKVSIEDIDEILKAYKTAYVGFNVIDDDHDPYLKVYGLKEKQFKALRLLNKAGALGRLEEY